MDLKTLLAATTFATGLRPDQLEVLAGRAEERNVAAGGALLTRNGQDYSLLVLLEGEAEVRGAFDHGVSVLKKGSLVGEIAWLDRKPRTADVIAKTDVRLAVFSPDLIAWLNLEHPDVTAQVLYNLSGVLAAKLRWAQKLIDASDAVNLSPSV